MAAVKHFALLPAAGVGSRVGGALPKQYVTLGGRPVLAHTLERLQSAFAFDSLFVIVARDDEAVERLIGTRAPVEILRCGGASRSETVANAVSALVDRIHDDDWMLVHDAVRPCVPADAVRRLVAEIADDDVGGLLALPLADTLKRGDDAPAPRVAATVNRSRLWRAQTPQMFRFGILRRAFARPDAAAATDEAQAVEAIGYRPRLVTGSAFNIKITYPDDLALASVILTTEALR
ncbi:MAG TPA: 2-C-methyl-D-erythritol 4-phosphate cytidylyltransferase [Casimicrobiaceae bacterium]|nr:2-C-methyl-D-erythritol 4-phosphate cytidylyltransferase [Casimicrobiaceae bacterium]